MSARTLQLPLFAAPPNDQVEYVPMICSSIVSETFSVDPYRGCEVGCTHCGASARRIFVKVDAPSLMARELERPDVRAHGVTIGAAADPYQPAERHFGVTRKLLEALLAARRRIPITIVTRSDLIRRDAALLERLAARHDLTVCFGCVTVDAELLRRLERRAPHPDARFRAMRALTERGVRCGTLLAPILPGITDGTEPLREVLRRARAAGSSFVHAAPLDARIAGVLGEFGYGESGDIVAA